MLRNNMSGLKLFTGNKLETLAGQLAQLLSNPTPNALEPEIIVVQSQGIQRWVSMELARRLGICANCRFPFPNAFVQDIFSRVLPGLIEREKNFFDPGILTWKIMQLVPGLLDRPAFAGLRAYLDGDRLGLKSFQLAQRIARTFDQYQVFRPEMIIQWEQGDFRSGTPEERWQFELWREIAQTTPDLNRASSREKFFEWVKNPTVEKENLPQRVFVFGISSLPRFHLEILAALGRLIEVNLFLMKPSLKPVSSEDELPGEGKNSLLEYMGTPGLEFFAAGQDLAGTVKEFFHDPGESTLLSCLQSDNLHNRSRDGVRADRKTI